MAPRLPLLVIAFLFFHSLPVLAAEAPVEKEARRHYEEGLAQYHLGHFELAVTEFKTAYELSKKPKLLFNIAQALRLGGHHGEAIYFYRTYLRLMPRADNREDVEEFIAESEAALRAEQERARAAQAEAARERERLAQAQRQAQRERRLHRTGLWTAGSGVLLAGVGGIFAWRASSADDELTAVADAGGTWTDELARRQREGERDDLIGTSLLFAGSAAALAGLVVYTWDTWHFGEPSGTPRVAFSGRGASLWLDWQF